MIRSIVFSSRGPLLRGALFALLLSVPSGASIGEGPGQSTSRIQDEGASAAVAENGVEAHVLDRAFVLGASLSKGFLVPVSLADVLDAAITRPHETTTDVSSLMMFSSPDDVLERQLSRVQEARPSLIVGVDLAFWFGYGDVSLESRVMFDEDRVINLKRFLERLESVPGRIVLADFPDMRIAIGFMLRAEQVPSRQVIEALNETLYAWAAGRERVIVLPLRELTDAIRADEGVTIGETVWPAAGDAGRIVQADRLHPTLEGLVLITSLLVHHLVEAEWVQAGDLVRDPDELLAAVRARLSSTPERSTRTHAERAGRGSSESGSGD